MNIILEQDPKFLALLAEHGFKKKKNVYGREYEETDQELIWGYAKNGEKDARFYSCTFYVHFHKVEEVARDMGELIQPIGTHIGYLLPQNTFVEWRFSKSDNQQQHDATVSSICDSLSGHIIPFMNHYSHLGDFVRDVESGKMPCCISFDRKYLPLAYYVMGDYERVRVCMEETMRKQEEESQIPPKTDFLFPQNADVRVFVSSQDRNYKMFEAFSKKLELKLAKSEGQNR